MAVTHVSAAHQHPVGAVLQRPQNMVGRYGSGTHDANRPDIGGVTQPAHAGQVRRSVGAPVTHECNYFGFKSIFFHNTLLIILYSVIRRLERP